jgi:hypothetical protein
VKVDDLLDVMLEKGLTPQFVAHLTDVPIERVRKRPAAESRFSVEETDLDAAMADLIWQAHEEASELLHAGSPATKLRIIGWLLGPAARTLGKQRQHGLDELRESLQSLIEPEEAAS